MTQWFRLALVLFLFALGGAGLDAEGLEVQYEDVVVMKKSIAGDFDSDLTYLTGRMEVLGREVLRYRHLSQVVIKECESLKVLFRRALMGLSGVPLDFILQTHPSGISPAVSVKYNHTLSRDLVAKVILTQKYDAVAFEGSAIGGFSIEVGARELFARLQASPGSTLEESIAREGVNTNSYEEIRPYLLSVLKKNDPGRWRELESQTSARFIPGESVALSTLMGEVMRGMIGSEDAPRMKATIQRLRSAYVVAETIEYLKAHPGQRAAIVFGFLHYSDFKQMAASLGMRSRIWNASSASWENIKKP